MKNLKWPFTLGLFGSKERQQGLWSEKLGSPNVARQFGKAWFHSVFIMIRSSFSHSGDSPCLFDQVKRWPLKFRSFIPANWKHAFISRTPLRELTNPFECSEGSVIWLKSPKILQGIPWICWFWDRFCISCQRWRRSTTRVAATQKKPQYWLLLQEASPNK